MISEWYGVLEEIRKARVTLGNPKVVWYRGQSSSAWKLIPSLHRQPNGLKKERDLFNEFQKSAARLFKKRDNDWETLFDMQHYGVPTRLLDWTEALGVAVAFAILDHHPSHGEPSLWVLDPVRLNRYSGIREVKEIPSPAFEYQTVYWEKIPFAAKFPIAVASLYQNDRMFAQRGTFTVHGSDKGAINEICPDAVVEVRIPISASDGAKEFLDYADLNPYRIYPDIVGMARHIRRKHLGE
ncbi:MAG: FRG domain-containing protein [Acidobacteriota bacterium]|nr:FRG domain-containing protein [Acidobacteriota bacterium]